ncbi:hypothetical protein DYU11_20910 [Fibrisoma montanum]|uniref:Uncharacterized protein n=2 Tax=Fibrisoma montanum TaxID=2305895 RepID=A0A418M423_9BACT|nr:hypothetical protein DYU11_20910 [Fibrisoma montanum]
MTVGESDFSLVMSALSSTPVKSLNQNHYLFLKITAVDTTLFYARIHPDRGYDVPEDALLQLKLYGRKSADEDKIVDLLLVKGYHTRQGPLLASARIDAPTARLLQQQRIGVLRINKVSTNESDMVTDDWYPMADFGRAFTKGAGMLFATPFTATPKAVPTPKQIAKKKK